MSAEHHSGGSSSPPSLKLQSNLSASYHPSISNWSQPDYPVTGGSLHVGSSPSSLPLDQLSSSGGARPKTQASEATQRELPIEGKPSVKEDSEGNSRKRSTLAFEILVDVQYTLSASVSNIQQKHTKRIPVDYVQYIRWQLITTCPLLSSKAMGILESCNIGITFWGDRVSLTIRDNTLLQTNKVTQIILDVVEKLDKDTSVLPPIELPEGQIVYLRNELLNSISFKIMKLYFEVIDKTVCIACFGEDAKHEVLDIVSHYKNTLSLDRPQTVSVCSTLPAFMEKILLYFKVFEKCQSQCQDVKCTTVNQNAQFYITLTGSKESVHEAWYLISSYIDKLTKSKCRIFFSINTLTAIDTLSLEDVIQQHLDNKGFMCAVVQCGREMYLYSDNPIEQSWKAASEAAKAICSKSVLLTGSWRDKYDDLKKSVESCVTGPYLLQSRTGAEMNILGYVSDVEKAAKVIEGIMAGEINLKQSTQQGLTSSSLITEKNTGSHNFVNQQKNQYIKNCESYKSKAETKSLEHDRGHSYAVMSCQGDDRVWSFPEGSVLFLTHNAKEYRAKVVVRLSMQVSDEAHFSCCGKSEDGVHADLRLLRWTGGSQNEREEFERQIKKTLVKVNEEEANSVMLMVDEMLGWNKVFFLQSLIGPLVQHLERRKTKPKKIILCVPNEAIFLEAVKEIQCRVVEPYKGEVTASCGQLRVCVVEGMIHETKADILVNTTAANLDLNHGQVSSAILRAAGMEIQYECWNKFPNGLHLGEMAVTKGYKLKCKNVFHGTLPKFSHKNEVESIQNLRTLVETCLCKADKNRFKSIAFPAIGAGNLEYPVAVVASEMFGAVDRFKMDHTQLSLRNVFFVIHPKDTSSLVEFRKIEQDLVKPIQSTRSGSPDDGKQAKVQPTRAEGLDDGKQTEVQSSRQVHELTVGTKIFPNILRQEYDALRHFFDRELQLCFAEAGIMMGFRNNVISIKGEKGAVKQAYTKIGTCLKYIGGMRQKCIPLQQTENDVKQTVKQYNKKNPQVFCFFDQVRTVLIFMSENKDDLERVSHMLHKELCGAGKEANGQAKMKMDSPKNGENKTTASVQGNSSSLLKSQAQILDKKNGDSNDTALIQRQQHEAKIEVRNADEVSDQIAGRKPMLASGTVKVIPSFIESRDCLNCIFTKGFVVKIFTASILELSDMDTIVCSEDQSGKAAGMIAKALLKQGGVEYQREKAAAFKVPPPPGEIVTTGGGKSNFKTIIHALVPLRRDDTNIKSLYLKIFQEAIAANSDTLAMSLLATGAGGQEDRLASKILYNSCMEFCQNNPDGRLNVSVVNIDNFKTKDIVGVFKEFINQHSIDLPPMTSPSSWKQTSQPSTNPVTPPTTQKTKETELVDREVKKMCPTCGEVCGVILGDQPDGMLQVRKSTTPLAGHPGCGSISFCYVFPDGKQQTHHPSPGMEYKGFRCVAYLPDNDEGRKVAAMLIEAFKRRLVFTIGRSRTTGKDGVIKWNDIYHKTDLNPNTQFGYPDPSYLPRVTYELAANGVTEKVLKQPFLLELSKPIFEYDVMADSTVTNWVE